MQLLRLVAGQVKAGQPLPFGIRDEHGKLLGLFTTTDAMFVLAACGAEDEAG